MHTHKVRIGSAECSHELQSNDNKNNTDWNAFQLMMG